jgi:preprotein translocase subunit SecD
MGKNRLAILFIFAITAVALVIDWPRLPIKFNVGPFKVDTILAGPRLDTELLGIPLKRDLDLKLGLDLQGGTDLTLKADMTGIAEKDRDDALNSAKEVLERRVNLYGVLEPVVQTAKASGEYRIIIQLPGIKDVDQAKQLVGQTAKLEFREPIDLNNPPQILTLENTKPSGISGKDLKSADVGFSSGQSDTSTSAPVVNFEIKDESAEKFKELTKRLLQKPLAIFLDDVLLSAPVVQSEISNKGQITLGSGTSTDYAKSLATSLKAGALPVKKIDIISERTVGATLGQESVQQSLVAGIVGLVVIGIFMIFFYGLPGLLANLALIVYTLVSIALFKTIPITLTLAGIAGFILSIGMAVDANVLIFERMKEEMRAGRLRKQAIEIGFSRAWNSIRDSNVSSLITTAILFYFGTGQVRGFALTLAVGILVSMFTAITVTRSFLRFVYKE